MIAPITTGSIGGDLGETLAAIAAARFEGIKILENDFLGLGGMSSGRRSDGRFRHQAKAPECTGLWPA